MQRRNVPTGYPWWSEGALRRGLREHGSVAALSRAWSVHESTLREWVDRHGIDLEDP